MLILIRLISILNWSIDWCLPLGRLLSIHYLRSTITYELMLWGWSLLLFWTLFMLQPHLCSIGVWNFYLYPPWNIFHMLILETYYWSPWTHTFETIIDLIIDKHRCKRTIRFLTVKYEEKLALPWPNVLLSYLL